MTKQTFNSIQALRGIAALLICCVHCITSKIGSNENTHSVISELGRIFISIGNWGVDLFFIISGFIITLLIFKTNECSFKNAFCFLIKRFFRIYPLFWITISVAAFITFLIGYRGIEFQKLYDFKVILLLAHIYPFLGVAWTLSFEVFFYLGVFLFLCFFNKKYFIQFLLCWGGILFIFIILHHNNIFTFNYYTMTDPRVLEFFIGGLLLPILIRRKNVFYDKYISITFGAIVILIGASNAYVNVPKHAYLGYWEIVYLNGFGSALLLYGFVGLEYHNKIYIPTSLKKLGDISYSIYLWHFPIIGLSLLINLKLNFYQHLPIIYHSIIEIITTILISILSYYMIERPSIHYSQRLSFKILSKNKVGN
ncbi:acyltransferase family protein [Commensalibacter papalotli (ex Servin-Garciduenas et al. 2014)]|uniref:Exopolysaccharide production protein EXOZ n=1 Tax=Commensalibacter papalotli (ex Servin-Garciduenas et al. 2014) TaxID=1208583 RepID=W7DV76_9PROT|nr:acyltransferase [Commensalibacter papalotli (ex Servin-Garciduenas et al. 2014)]EUK18920.1 exopolysaccharide production protein EXOZ [Commensalibacter papalotli (ex Servin-Garciduenas et al. 2014)]